MNKLPALVALAILLPAGPLFADLKANEPAPPVPQSETLTVYRGETTLIPLSAKGRLVEEARFLIRSQPKFGTLGEAEWAQPGRGQISYSHVDANGTGTDGFTFAVQSPGSPVSAPGKIRIRIIERPGSFSVPELTEFGATLTGRSSEQTLRLENTGGGIIEGDLKVPAPWTVMGRTHYRLARGESAEIRLRFSPGESRDFVAKVEFSHDAKTRAMLHGEGVAPFRVLPNGVDLQHPQRSVEKSTATVTVSNPQAQPLLLKITAPPIVEVPATLEVPAEGSTELTVRANPQSLTGGDGKILLTHANDTATLAVRVFPAPALLQTKPANVFALGKMEATDTIRGHFQIANHGGSPTEILLEPPRGVTLTTADRLTLAPGEERRITFDFDPITPGTYEDNLWLWFDRQKIPLKFTAQIEASGTSPEHRTAEITPETSAPSGNEPAATDTIALSFNQLFVSEQNYHEVKVAWKRPTQNAPASYRVNRRKLETSADGKIREIWEPMPHVTFGETVDSISATVGGLNPGQRFTIRIFSFDALGQLAASSPAFAIYSKPYVPKPLPHWLWVLPFILAVGFLIWVIRRQQRINRAADLSRIEDFTRS